MERLLTLYSEVQSTDVRWLWYPFIAIGKITLLQGDPGDGKSTMMMNLIAELSTGGKTPDGCKIGVPQKVIYQCSEDGVSDTIKPRLERCGADCRKIAFINEEVYNGLTLDDERIRQAIIEFRPRLVVIDPIQAYLGSDSDLQIAGRARKLMRRLGNAPPPAPGRHCQNWPAHGPSNGGGKPLLLRLSGYVQHIRRVCRRRGRHRAEGKYLGRHAVLVPGPGGNRHGGAEHRGGRHGPCAENHLHGPLVRSGQHPDSPAAGTPFFSSHSPAVWIRQPGGPLRRGSLLSDLLRRQQPVLHCHVPP